MAAKSSKPEATEGSGDSLRLEAMGVDPAQATEVRRGIREAVRKEIRSRYTRGTAWALDALATASAAVRVIKHLKWIKVDHRKRQGSPRRLVLHSEVPLLRRPEGTDRN